jgi:hypothetical protein
MRNSTAYLIGGYGFLAFAIYLAIGGKSSSSDTALIISCIAIVAARILRELERR